MHSPSSHRSSHSDVNADTQSSRRTLIDIGSASLTPQMDIVAGDFGAASTRGPIPLHTYDTAIYLCSGS